MHQFSVTVESMHLRWNIESRSYSVAWLVAGTSFAASRLEPPVLGTCTRKTPRAAQRYVRNSHPLTLPNAPPGVGTRGGTTAGFTHERAPGSDWAACRFHTTSEHGADAASLRLFLLSMIPVDSCFMLAHLGGLPSGHDKSWVGTVSERLGGGSSRSCSRALLRRSSAFPTTGRSLSAAFLSPIPMVTPMRARCEQSRKNFPAAPSLGFCVRVGDG